MKRSEMIRNLSWLIDDNGHKDSKELADLILDTIEEDGMLPPLNTVKTIPDGNGDFKHSETKREWDEE